MVPRAGFEPTTCSYLEPMLRYKLSVLPLNYRGIFNLCNYYTYFKLSVNYYLSEMVGFEPTDLLQSLIFKISAIDLSATLPKNYVDNYMRKLFIFLEIGRAHV